MRVAPEFVVVVFALVGVTWAENRPSEPSPPAWVYDRVRESCTEGVLAAIEESTNAFTRRFVTEEAVKRGVARCSRSELGWVVRMHEVTGSWERAVEGLE